MFSIWKLGFSLKLEYFINIFAQFYFSTATFYLNLSSAFNVYILFYLLYLSWPYTSWKSNFYILIDLVHLVCCAIKLKFCNIMMLKFMLCTINKIINITVQTFWNDLLPENILFQRFQISNINPLVATVTIWRFWNFTYTTRH